MKVLEVSIHELCTGHNDIMIEVPVPGTAVYGHMIHTRYKYEKRTCLFVYFVHAYNVHIIGYLVVYLF